MSSASYDKIFSTRKEAKQAEVDFEIKVASVRENKEKIFNKSLGDLLFKDFFESVIPEYDRDRVYVSHMKKICAYTILGYLLSILSANAYYHKKIYLNFPMQMIVGFICVLPFIISFFYILEPKDSSK